MPIYLIFACEIIVFSFLIGGFMNSTILAMVILCGSGLIMYAFFQWVYTSTPLVWGATLLGAITALLWASYIDAWLGTTCVALLLSLVSGTVCYLLNGCFFKRYQV